MTHAVTSSAPGYSSALRITSKHNLDYRRFLPQHWEKTVLARSLVHSMQHSPTEAHRFSASQEIPRILWNKEVHYRIHKCPSPVPILTSSIQYTPPHPTSSRPSLLLSHLRLGFPSGLFPPGFPTKTLYTPLLSPYALHAPLISFCSILSPEQYCKRIAPPVLNLYTSWKRVVNVTPRERTTLSSGQNTARHREGLEVLERAEISVPNGIRSLDRPVRTLFAIPTTLRELECSKERMVY